MAPIHPRRILLLGGTSDIGLAIVEQLLDRSPASVVLAVRPGSHRFDGVRERLVAAGATQVERIDFDALAPDTHARTLAWAFRSPVDLAIVAFGVLPDPSHAWLDQLTAVRTAQINYTAAVSVGVLLAEHMTAYQRVQQARGVEPRDSTIVFLGSMAGEQVRLSNFVYGSSKAGADAFYLNLGDAAHGVNVTVVRPGFVRTTLTAGQRRKPFATTPDRVAAVTIRAVDARARIVRVPAIFTALIFAYRLVPPRLRRRLPW